MDMVRLIVFVSAIYKHTGNTDEKNETDNKKNETDSEKK
jgi:hypothetical protein